MELHFIVDSIFNIGGMQTHAFAFARHILHNPGTGVRSLLVVHKPHRIRGMLGDLVQSNGEPLVIEELKKDWENDANTLLRNVGSKNAIVFANEPMWLPMLHLAKIQMPELRVIVRSGGNDLFSGWVSGSELHIETDCLVQMVNSCVDRLIVGSDFSRARYEELGVETHRIVKVAGGVDCQDFRPAPRPQNDVYRIANVCRFIEMKGIDVAIRVISELVKHGRGNVHYTVTGKGRKRIQSRLTKLTHKLGVSDHVTFAPAMPVSEVVSAYQAADMFLHTPRYAKRRNPESDSFYWHTETMGRSLCEASAVGLPIVTSRVGGVPEIVREGITGFMVEEGDYVAAAERVERLIEDTSLSRAMGQAGRKYALEQWNWPILFDKYRKIFSDLH